MLPVTLYVYFKYGRAAEPTSVFKGSSCASAKATHCDESNAAEEGKSVDLDSKEHMTSENAQPTSHCHMNGTTSNPISEHSIITHEPSDSDNEKGHSSTPAPHCQHHDSSRPMWVTVLVGVSHCGAGCVLGDIVGEFLVWGTGVTINGQMIWAELLIDYAFALLFGIAFQYFSIAPMTGEYGPKTIWRAAKADILSLTSFEVGAFAWMIIYQIGIFDYRLDVITWTYWW